MLHEWDLAVCNLFGLPFLPQHSSPESHQVAVCIHGLKDVWVLAVTSKAAVNIHAQVFVWMEVFIFWDKCLGMQLLNGKVVWLFKKLLNFSRAAVPFYVPTSRVCVSVCVWVCVEPLSCRQTGLPHTLCPGVQQRRHRVLVRKLQQLGRHVFVDVLKERVGPWKSHKRNEST